MSNGSRGTPPSGVITFLFTDIEGSTRRWEADADGMRSALAAHDEVLRDAVEGHGGWLFKHTGDGICAVFASPKNAVDAAVDAQRTLQLPVRMGIATGEAELRGDDYFGSVLNRVARLMAAGHGGQILLDGATAGLLNGVELISMGPKQLRDISGPVDVFQVNADGLAVDFPPLKTLDPKPGNFRPPNTAIIGRESELADICDIVKAQPMTTLTGVGGVGKTRLALEVGTRLADEFPDGVWVVELASVTDPAAVPEAVATILGISQQRGKSVAESISSALEGRRRLLIVDNCEHVLDAAADLLEKVLVRSTTTSVLATSREGLQLPGERLYPVTTLDTRTGPDSAAVALFNERAEAIAPGSSAVADSEAIIEICRRLDGIPLAIELAASRMASMTLTELRERLDDRFHLLVGARRRLERHQTLHHAVQWSYELLDDAERTLLQRCSVFVGGFDHDAAHSLSGSSPSYVTSDLLQSLVRKSLVIADRRGERTRFSMLETIRQFADEKLRQTGADDAIHDLHARYFAGRETDLLALWDSPHQRDAYTWLRRELPNLRAAFRWAADHGDLDTAAAIASYAAFVGYWVEQYEPVAWVEELIAAARAVGHPRLTQLYTLAAHCFITGRVGDAIGYISAAEDAIASGTYADLLPGLETWFGGAYIAAGDPRRWADQCRMSLARRPSGNITARAMLVLALNITDPSGEIRSSAAGLLDAAEATDNPQLACMALLAAGIAERSTDPVAAQAILERGQALALDTDNHLMWAHMSTTLSRLTATHGEPVDALGHLASAIRNFRDSGSFSLMFSPLAILTALFDRMGRYDPAATISGFAATEWTRQANGEFAPAVEHLRDVLGDEAFEGLAYTGASMTDGAMATYALEQIELARAQQS